MPFVVPELPCVGKEGPESCNRFPGPQLAGLFVGFFARSEVGFLVVDNGLVDVSSEKVLPADGRPLGVVMRGTGFRVVGAMGGEVCLGVGPLH